MSSIFLSHNHADKPFVRRLASDLKRAGARIWLDEAEIQIGDSLIQKIREGIDQMEYLGAVLSSASVKSGWVQQELDIAMNQQIAGKTVKVLPILIEDCELPGFLLGKLYADFRGSDRYDPALGQLLRRLGMSVGSIPGDSHALFPVLGGAIASGDDDLIRRVLVRFMELPDGSDVNLVRDVLGAAAGRSEGSGNIGVQELLCQTVLDAFVGRDNGAVASVEYLVQMPGYFPSPSKALPRGLTSPILAVRLSSALALSAYHLGGDSRDAEQVAENQSEALALRVASLRILGLAAHVTASEVLNRIAANADRESAAIHRALLAAMNDLGQRSADTQNLAGLASLFAATNVDNNVRLLAAYHFLKAERKLYEWARKPYASAHALALQLTKGNQVHETG